MNKLRITLFIITVVSIIAGFILSKETRVDEKRFLGDVAPDVIFSAKAGTPPHYSSDRSITAFNSYDAAPSVNGYAGPIKVLLAINSKGDITGIKVLEHKETENYVHYLMSSDYLGRFVGKNVNDPFEPDNDIDALSRATVSVDALADTVRRSSRMVAAKVYGLEVKGIERKKGTGAGWLVYLSLFLASLCIYYITRGKRGLVRARDVSLLLGILIIGIYLVTPFSILHVFSLILGRVSSSYLWYAVVISTFLSVIIAGRFYCGWLCPFGALAEFLGKIPMKKWEVSNDTDDRWRNLKYILLAIAAAVVFVSRKTEYGNFETYVTLFSLHGDYLAWMLVALMLIINVKVERFWCRYLCPVAALTGLFCRADNKYISNQDCPMGNRPKPLISECIRCNKCYVKAGEAEG